MVINLWVLDSFKNVVNLFWVCIFLNILCLHVIYKKSSIDCIIVKLSKEIHPEDGKELAYVSGREIRNAMYEIKADKCKGIKI